MRAHSFVRVSMVVVGLSAATALAGPITVIFQGRVEVGFGYLTEQEPVSGSFSYDTSALPTSTGPGSAFYLGGLTLNNLLVAGVGFLGSAASHSVRNDAPTHSPTRDHYDTQWFTTGPSLPNGDTPSIIELSFFGPNTILSDVSLPEPAQLDLFTSRSGVITFDDEFGFPTGFAVFSILSLEYIVVPLPGGAAMAMVGMGVIGVRRRRPTLLSQDN